MDKKKIYRFIGSIMGILTFVMSWVLYDWKLALIIFFALWSNNIEQIGRNN